MRRRDFLLLAPLAALRAAFRDNIIPTRNSTTGQLTLPHHPYPASSLHLYVEGLLQSAGVDYTLSGATITPVPANRDLYRTARVIRASYRT